MKPSSLASVEMLGRALVIGVLVALLVPPQAGLAALPQIRREQIADDAIGEEQVDWGTGSEQVAADDMPVDDGAWTNLAPEDPFVVVSAGRAYFRVEDLLRLGVLIERLDEAGSSRGESGEGGVK